MPGNGNGLANAQENFANGYYDHNPNGNGDQGLENAKDHNPNLGSDANVYDLQSGDPGTQSDPTVFSGVDGEVDIFVFDMNAERDAQHYFEINNFGDEDYIVFVNFDVNGDGLLDYGDTRMKLKDGVDDPSSYNLVGVSASHISAAVDGNKSFAAIDVYSDDGITPVAGLNSSDPVFEEGLVTDVLGPVVFYANDMLI